MRFLVDERAFGPLAAADGVPSPAPSGKQREDRKERGGIAGGTEEHGRGGGQVLEHRRRAEQ